MDSILIVYMTKNNSTAETVNFIKSSCTKKCDLKNAGEVTDNLDDYSTVVIGMPLYFESIPREIEKFCKKHKEALLEKKVLFFIQGLLSEKEYKECLESKIDKELLSHAVSIDFIGGKYDIHKANVFKAFFLKQILKSAGLDTTNPNTLDSEKIKSIIERINR